MPENGRAPSAVPMRRCAQSRAAFASDRFWISGDRSGGGKWGTAGCGALWADGVLGQDEVADEATKQDEAESPVCSCA